MARIAVVEDSGLMRGVIQRLLEGAGHTTLLWEPHSAVDIKNRVVEEAPDLLITDYQMPEVDGITVVKVARTAQPSRPILVLTAKTDPEIHRRLKEAGARAILLKPLEGKELMDAVQLLVSR